jgi:hypothetical protein
VTADLRAVRSAAAPVHSGVARLSDPAADAAAVGGAATVGAATVGAFIAERAPPDDPRQAGREKVSGSALCDEISDGLEPAAEPLRHRVAAAWRSGAASFHIRVGWQVGRGCRWVS